MGDEIEDGLRERLAHYRSLQPLVIDAKAAEALEQLIAELVEQLDRLEKK